MIGEPRTLNQPYEVAAKRFWPKVDKDGPGGCWIWTGSRNAEPKPYGRFVFRTRVMTAHRFAYEFLVGPIPENHTLHHTCEVKSCVNPEHLVPMSMRENLLSHPNSIAAKHAAKTECPKCGGPYKDKADGSGRYCPKCHYGNVKKWADKNPDYHLEYKRAWRQRRREQGIKPT